MGRFKLFKKPVSKDNKGARKSSGVHDLVYNLNFKFAYNAAHFGTPYELHWN